MTRERTFVPQCKSLDDNRRKMVPEHHRTSGKPSLADICNQRLNIARPPHWSCVVQGCIARRSFNGLDEITCRR